MPRPIPEDQEKLIIMKADMSSYNDMMNFVKEVKEKAGHVITVTLLIFSATSLLYSSLSISLIDNPDTLSLLNINL